MTQPISAADPTTMMGELAVLLVDIDSQRSESARLERKNARASYLENAQHQVDSLHAAADATTNGAFVGAAFTVGSAGLSLLSASSEYKADVAKATGACSTSDQFDANALSASAKTASALGESGKTIIGDVTAQDRQADAKRYETLATQAQWRASDASSDIDKAEKQSDKALDLLQDARRDQHAANNAVIGRI